ISMKDQMSTKKNTLTNTSMEKMRHIGQTKIADPYFFQIDDTTIQTKHGLLQYPVMEYTILIKM
ncbi:MAG: hypothetical protein AABY31_01315, partial [Thermoproteota archaeon]